MMNNVRTLTGITTTGSPHIGNYVGAIRPAIQASLQANTESFYFLADFHALIKCAEPERIQRSTLEIAATWLALGLNPEHVWFYRQSDVPQIPELTWILTCVTAKGLLNRAHAYKAAVDQNLLDKEDPDASITAGLYQYPVLMAADILMFNAHLVPVGKDQVQHIEIARDIAKRFNYLYGDLFVLPEARVDAHTSVLPGLDGRKMSKSYDNTIPLWCTRKELRKKIMGIVTNAQLPGEPKNPDESALFNIYQGFASAEQSDKFRVALQEGLGWGDAKQMLFECIDQELTPARERYEQIIAQPNQLEEILQQGALRARAVAEPILMQVRQAIGLRALTQATVRDKTTASKSKTKLRWVSYREEDHLFYFKLLDSDNQVLLQSVGFDSPKSCGQQLAYLQKNPNLADIHGQALRINGTQDIAFFPEAVNSAHVLQSIQCAME